MPSGPSCSPRAISQIHSVYGRPARMLWGERARICRTRDRGSPGSPLFCGTPDEVLKTRIKNSGSCEPWPGQSRGGRGELNSVRIAAHTGKGPRILGRLVSADFLDQAWEAGLSHGHWPRGTREGHSRGGTQASPLGCRMEQERRPFSPDATESTTWRELLLGRRRWLRSVTFATASFPGHQVPRHRDAIQGWGKSDSRMKPFLHCGFRGSRGFGPWLVWGWRDHRSWTVDHPLGGGQQGHGVPCPAAPRDTVLLPTQHVGSGFSPEHPAKSPPI